MIFETNLEIASKDQVAASVIICDKPFKTPWTSNGKNFNFNSTLTGNQECEEEFYFEFTSSSGGKFSIANFILIFSKDNDKKLIRLNDTSNFVFAIDDEVIEDYDKFYLNDNFPPFTKQVSSFKYITEFKEITLLEIEKTEKYHDYCFSFSYFNLDNKINLQLLAENSNFSFNLLDLYSTYFEADEISYKWSEIFNLCLFQMFRFDDLDFKLDDNKLILKLVSTKSLNENKSLFAISNFIQDINRPIKKDLKPFYRSWKSSVVPFEQWNYYPKITNHLHHYRDPEFKIRLRSKAQNRMIEFNCLGEIIEYEQSTNVLTFDLDSTFEQAIIKVDWIDLFGKKLKTVSSMLNSIEGQNSKLEFAFSELNAQQFTSRASKKYRIVINIAIPKGSTKEIKESKKTVHNLTISNLQYSDPCNNRFCGNHGQCIPLSINRFKCDCDSNYTGDHCQYLNSCVNKIGNETGNQYCARHKTNKCIPKESHFECECPENKYWSELERNCTEIDPCAFEICGLNEICKIRDKKAKCICKDNYKFNSKTRICELDLCQV